jgi:hypothetical protein
MKNSRLAAKLLLVLAALALLLSSCEQPAGVTLDSDAALQSLSLSAGNLTPPFDPETTEYTATVNNAVGEITITAQPNSAKATVSPGGGESRALNVGENPISVVVTPENTKARKTYTVTVKRLGNSVTAIETPDDLAMIDDNEDSLAGDYALIADIELENWTPAGSAAAPFSGSFDGGGYTITIKSFAGGAVSGNNYLGIFGYVKGGSAASKAGIKDITVVSSVNAVSAMADGQAVGLLAGYTENTEISGISIQGSLAFSTEKTIYAGGLVGIAQRGTVIRDCTGSAVLDAKGGTGGALVPGLAVFNYVGGFVGIFIDGVDITNCRNMGNVTSFCTVAGSQVYAGGIAGGSYYDMSTAYHGKIEDCSYIGTVHATAMGYWTWAGGIAGCIVGDGDGSLENTTRIVRCYAAGTVSVAGTSSGWPYVGGIAAYNYYGALISRSCFDGDVIADSGADYAGGIAGYNSRFEGHNSRIEDCWSAGTVTGFNNAGGIVGQNQMETYVRRCYSTATVIATDTGVTGVGGIAGMNASDMPGAITGCVALNPLIQAGSTANIHRITGGGPSTENINNLAWSGMTVTTDGDYTPDIGADQKDGADCEEKPAQSVYEGLGWDFTGVWKMQSGGYPVLQWQ